LPEGLTADLAKLTDRDGTIRPVGTGAEYLSGASSTAIALGCYIDSGAPSVLQITHVSGGGNFGGGSGAIGSGSMVLLDATIPIVQWTSNVNLATDFQEFASNSNQDNADNLIAFDYSSTGTLVPVDLTVGRTKRVRFQRPIQPTDRLILELSDNGTTWVDATNAITDGSTYVVVPLTQQNTVDYGVGRLNPVNSTDVDIRFGQYCNTSNSSFGGAAMSWNSARAAGVRWRVRKISNGNFAEQPTQVLINKSSTPVFADIGAGIIESGSNANGSYIKYSDGTMVQWGAVTTTTGSAASNLYGTTSGGTYYAAAGRTFPTPFISQPLISSALISPAAVGYTSNIGSLTASTFSGIVGSGPDNNATVVFTYVAIGRWRA
jgi:hypothetical protein